MRVINKPMEIPSLNVQPPFTGKIPLSDDMQQTLALLTALCDSKRVPIRATQQGVLNVASAPLADIFHVTASGDNYTYQGDIIPCTEVMVMGHPSNSGNVWVRTYDTATTDNAWPLAAKGIVSFTINNLSQLQLLIETSGEKAIIAYTR